LVTLGADETSSEVIELAAELRPRIALWKQLGQPGSGSVEPAEHRALTVARRREAPARGKADVPHRRHDGVIELRPLLTAGDTIDLLVAGILAGGRVISYEQKMRHVYRDSMS
jgi:hypothetical protein